MEARRRDRYAILADARRAARGEPVLGAASIRQGKPGTRRLPHPTCGPVPSTTGSLATPIKLFIICFILPWTFSIMGMRTSPYRLVLMAMLIPCLWHLFSKKAGTIRLADMAILVFCAWGWFCFIVNHGLQQSLQPGGMLVIETVSPYLLARCYVRSSEDFASVSRLLFLTVAIILPFALVEFLTGRNLILELAGAVLPTYNALSEPRGAFWRASGPFDHPILYGVHCAAIFPLALLGSPEIGTLRRYMRGALVVLASVLSLSSGPLAAVMVQAGLVLWNAATSFCVRKWQLLAGLAVAGYLFLAIVARRGPFEILTTSFVLNPDSYWSRLFIWGHAYQSILNHPIIGVGNNDWDRPAGVYFSIDNFWILQAIRFGFPGVLLVAGLVLSILVPVCCSAMRSKTLQIQKFAFLLSMAGFLVASMSVTFWDIAYTLFFFLLGAGAWLLDPRLRAERRPEEAARPTSISGPSGGRTPPRRNAAIPDRRRPRARAEDPPTSFN